MLEPIAVLSLKSCRLAVDAADMFSASPTTIICAGPLASVIVTLEINTGNELANGTFTIDALVCAQLTGASAGAGPVGPVTVDVAPVAPVAPVSPV